jgi:hypothetical protein
LIDTYIEEALMAAYFIPSAWRLWDAVGLMQAQQDLCSDMLRNSLKINKWEQNIFNLSEEMDKVLYVDNICFFPYFIWSNGCFYREVLRTCS